MHPPEFVRGFMERRAAEIPFRQLERAVAAMTGHYRAGQGTAQLPLTAGEKLAAYVVCRFPATYAAAFHALRETASRLNADEMRSSLDLGAGMGAATIAAREIFSSLGTVTLLETDAGFRKAGEELLPQGQWQAADLRGNTALPEHDLVVMSYALSEVPAVERMGIVDRAWRAAGKALVLIEPGSPNGFAIIREARDHLLRQGAHILAPCPSESPCPIAEGDWCHFAQRIERSSLHRKMKHATLSYEDEKFSYVAVGRAETQKAAGRVLRRPVHHPGLIELVVCQDGATRNLRVTRRTREMFRAARQASWGDEWQFRKE